MCTFIFLPLSSFLFFFFFLIIRRPPRSTLFPYTRSSDLTFAAGDAIMRQGETAVASAVRGPELSKAISPNTDRKSTRLNSSHTVISYAVFCLKKKKKKKKNETANKK